MEFVNEVYDTIWSEKFWLPPNVTWNDLNSRKDIHIVKPRELWLAFPLAIVLFVLRLIWERLVALPIGRYFGISESAPKRAEDNAVLEKAFRQYRRVIPKNAELTGLAKQVDLTPRQVERWWRRRRVQDKHSEMQRWKETSWRFLFYICAFYYGLYVLWDKAWLWDTKHCWYDYPYHNVTADIWWYYMIELGFYWSLVLSLFIDVKRKDFAEMIIHHVATITLLAFSWANNMVRIGTIVLLVHDAVDYWMEGAKLAKYAKFHKLCDILFVIFTVVWFITRIVLYPYRVIQSTLFESCKIADYCSAGQIVFNILLIILQILHIFWFLIILRMCYDFIVNGQVEKDERSETEDNLSQSEDEGTQTHKQTADGLSNNNLASKDSAAAASGEGVFSNGSAKQQNGGSPGGAKQQNGGSPGGAQQRGVGAGSRIPTRRNAQREH